MHGVGYPGAARDRQAIDIDRFQGHGQFFLLVDMATESDGGM